MRKVLVRWVLPERPVRKWTRLRFMRKNWPRWCRRKDAGRWNVWLPWRAPTWLRWLLPRRHWATKRQKRDLACSGSSSPGQLGRSKKCKSLLDWNSYSIQFFCCPFSKTLRWLACVEQHFPNDLFRTWSMKSCLEAVIRDAMEGLTHDY